MSCRFCELKRSRTTGSYWWEKSGEAIDSFYIDQQIKITEDGKEYDKHKVNLNSKFEDCETSVEINFCPMCGRKLGD